MKASLWTLPSQVVTVGDMSSSWRERAIPADHPVLSCDEWVALERRVAGALGVDDVNSLGRVYWLNEYPPERWAPRHVDRAGDAQLVAYLSGGSEIELLLGSSSQAYGVGCGDAILFEASRIPHATLPKEDTRVSIVARYFLADLTTRR